MNSAQTLTQRITALGLWEKNIFLTRNEFLTVKGNTDTNVYMVDQGSLRMFVEDEFEEQTIRFAYEGNIFACLDAFISGKPSDIHIQALKKTSLKSIKKSTFMQFLQSSNENLALWLQIMEQLIYQQMERERDILTLSPIERYHRVLSRSPQLFQKIPSKYIASYLRMTPETLSRIKKS